MSTTETFTMRQSTLQTFSRCPLSARFEIEAGEERYSPEMSRGTLAHRVVEEILRTLHRTGGDKIPVAEGLEVMYEVLAQAEAESEDVLSIPPEEKVNLRQFVVRFCQDYSWRTNRIMALEERLFADIVCEDGVVRVLSGAPDIILAEPPHGLVICDTKSGWGPQKQPRDSAPLEPRRYLTERGNYQLDAYGLLALNRWPRAQYATLKEIHPRSGDVREATLDRSELEHVRRLVGIDLMLLERALREGPESEAWKPVPGKPQCQWCKRPRDCPVGAKDRGEGQIDSPDVAVLYALDAEVLTAKRDATLKAAKAWVDANGPIPLPDGRVLGWQQKERSRSFCAHWPEPEEASS